MIIVQSHPDLPEMVCAFETARRFPGRDHRRQKQSDQDGKYSTGDQQFQDGQAVSLRLDRITRAEWGPVDSGILTNEINVACDARP